METKRLLCLLGGIILGGSVFCPILSAPILGSFSYIDHWPFTTALVLGAGLVALLLAVLNAVQVAWVPGYISLLVASGTLYQFYMRRLRIAGRLGSRYPFHPLMRGLAGTIHLQWGLAVVIVGGALVTIAAYLPSDQLDAEAALERSDLS